MIIQSETKSDTAKAKNSSNVLTHFVIKSIAEVQNAAKSPLHENMKEKQNPPVQMLIKPIASQTQPLFPSRSTPTPWHTFYYKLLGYL
jgi:hypothetical protein